MTRPKKCLFVGTIVLILPLRLAADELLYNRDIRPILSDRCFFCHGPDEEERQADLRLDQSDAAKEYAIVPGVPDESELIARIVTEDPDERMPPPESGKVLTPREIELLRRWIQEGAEYQPYWAYVPPQFEPAGDAPDALADWPLNWIDQLLAKRMIEEGVQPNPPADAATLIRRLSFDLTGLPPTTEMVSKFVDSPSEEHYQQIVSQLLASERFGERMAMYWLDLVRYADTVGYHGDQDHSISPYRDYVIEAFNDNMPFDQFTREQLAGDLLPDATLDQQIATGYNRLLQTSHEGGVQPKEYLAIYMADRIRNVSAVWMAATMGCCQCHNHKYDPYTIEDFYSFGAFFADIDEAGHFTAGGNSLPTNRPPEISVLSKRERGLLAGIERRIDELGKISESDSDSGQSNSIDGAAAVDGISLELQKLRALKAQLETSQRKTMVTEAIEPRVVRLLPRGNWLDDSGPIVTPRVPEFLPAAPSETASQRRLTRLDLAEWLVDSRTGVGGFTARVQVNRFWYLLFGTGIARVLDDFGGQGEPPVHPELLDRLAIEFVDSGWNVKHILRTIVTSRAYRQSSTLTEALHQRDPYNQLFARQSAHRLPSEMIRDQALLLGNLLVQEVGGAPVKPYQPAGYYRHLNFPTREYQPDADTRQWRRGIYMHWQRQFLHPMLKATDAPSREECTAERPRSNTPLAALALLNDPSFVEAARAFAERAMSLPNRTDESRLEWIFKEALFRSPDETESAALHQLLIHRRETYAADPEAARKLVGIGNSTPDGKLDVEELAAWTALTRVVMNLDETITRR